MVDRVAADIGTDHVGWRTVGVDVVGSILGVIFEDEDGGFRPDGTMGDMLDQFAEGQVVVGYLGDRAISAFMETTGMVIGQIDGTEMRQCAGFYQRVEIGFEDRLPENILDA